MHRKSRRGRSRSREGDILCGIVRVSVYALHAESFSLNTLPVPRQAQSPFQPSYATPACRGKVSRGVQSAGPGEGRGSGGYARNPGSTIEGGDRREERREGGKVTDEGLDVDVWPSFYTPLGSPLTVQSRLTAS